MSGDPASWYRESCIVMSIDTHTPATFWNDMSLYEFAEWVKSKNEVYRRMNEKRGK